MKEKTVIVVMQPRDPLWQALCERTCDLARYLEDIESAELVSRETTPKGLTRHVHFWRARANVPAILAPHIDASFLAWTGKIEWQANDYKSRWIVEPQFMKEAVLCEAVMDFSPAVGGRGTRLDLQLEIMGLQRPLGFQTIMKTILTTHFRKLVGAATQLIEAG
ncbi:MAG TPA: hypothetical protein VM639_10845 [Dongiaceae bacterium]|nr:hypothetical protein [Dongiaceae bacterium]